MEMHFGDTRRVVGAALAGIAGRPAGRTAVLAGLTP
jgi:hypothetical protein